MLIMKEVIFLTVKLSGYSYTYERGEAGVKLGYNKHMIRSQHDPGVSYRKLL